MEREKSGRGKGKRRGRRGKKIGENDGCAVEERWKGERKRGEEEMVIRYGNERKGESKGGRRWMEESGK